MTTTTDINMSFNTTSTPEEVQDRIAQPNVWWMEDYSGQSTNIGDQFTVRAGTTVVDFEVLNASPTLVSWKVLDCDLPFLEDTSEWTGTQVDFDIQPNGTGSTVTLTHNGLGPEKECYEMCTQGWTQYFANSLKSYLETGVASPVKKETAE